VQQEIVFGAFEEILVVVDEHQPLPIHGEVGKRNLVARRLLQGRRSLACHQQPTG
jgi:hypothetical protein